MYTPEGLASNQSACPGDRANEQMLGDGTNSHWLMVEGGNQGVHNPWEILRFVEGDNYYLVPP